MKAIFPVALVCCVAAPAQLLAADAVQEPDFAGAPAFVWSGGYIGGQVGYAWGNGHAQNTDGAYSDPDPDGFLGGVYIGYNYQMSNNVVVGLEADAAFSDIDGSGSAYFGDGTLQSGAVFEEKLNWSGAARVRLGYAVDRFLPYIAGGVAFGDVNVDTSLNGTPVDSFSDTYVGWTIGAGVEYAFTDNMIGRFEYRYTDFGSADFVATAPGAPFSIDLNTSDVRFGLAWKF